MQDGTETVGKHSRARSKRGGTKNTQGSIGLVKQEDADFVFLQEVDVKATRSYQVNQRI